MRLSGRRAWGYGIYALLLIAVLLCVRFPGTKAEAYLVSQLELVFPDATITTGEYSYSFPLSLDIDRVTVSSRDGEEEIARLEKVKLTPIATGLGLQYSLAGEISEGTFTARLALAPFEGKYSVEDVKLRTIRLQQWNFFRTTLQREIGGELSFDGSFGGPLDGSEGFHLAGNFIVQNGRFALRRPVLTAADMEMKPLTGDISYSQGMITLTQGSLKGAEVSADFSGEMRVTEQIKSWTLALSGTMTPQQDYLEANPQAMMTAKRRQRQFSSNTLPYIVSGTITSPLFSFRKQ